MEDLGEKLKTHVSKIFSEVTGQKLDLGEVEESQGFLEVKK